MLKNLAPEIDHEQNQTKKMSVLFHIGFRTPDLNTLPTSQHLQINRNVKLYSFGNFDRPYVK